jgi:hypothetical protein
LGLTSRNVQQTELNAGRTVPVSQKVYSDDFLIRRLS